MDVLQGLIDILRLGERDASNIGKQTFLPDSFIGGPRDMRQRYMDAIALVQCFGKPDLFITMTCNPSWPEIEEHLAPSDEAQNRPDLISRVFKAKIEELKTDILKRNIFGKVVAFMYTVEFQKRGLPHAHFLIILCNEHKLLTPEAYDEIIRAELPDCNTDPDLHKLVVKHMMHGPCGSLNPTNTCMRKKGYCKFKYPKMFADQTSKGHDRIAFSVQHNDTNVEIDEVKEYRSARWVSPPEAGWRIFRFPISEMSPSVYRLQLHLEGQQFVSFKKNMDVNAIVNNPMIRKIMLTEFFYMNRTDHHATELNLLYREFPEHFVWSSGENFWARRQRRSTVGRIVTCHPTEGERYYLRLLLTHVRGPTSYADLLMPVITYQMPYSLRRLFATLLVYCNPTNPRDLWEQFEESMSEDYKRPSTAGKEAKEIHFERTITLSEEDVLLHKKLNKKQLTAYDLIIKRVFSNKSGAFFVDGLGGIGKTFLYRALLATVRSMGYIALAPATSGVAASILPGGRTAHSRFKIPINIDENVTCNISKQSALASLIRDAKLILWDEASMANKRMVELFDLLLKDLMDTDILFGGKVVVFGGDFRQTLPVVRNGKREDFVKESLLYSTI
ncbi:uncharacterized protein LOC132637774 [Lycium barbarum]|uniref:uncharacterized protein LOC132637774 n=1 Tax=Lycium barbarum TaxID=112863 RepID=UPI00293E7E1D|nr:uncharacterized protein LOC132637774 [Lycium barbarum]